MESNYGQISKLEGSTLRKAYAKEDTKRKRSQN